MTKVTFDKVAIGSTFTYKNGTYVKTETRKVSCCKFNNAYSTTDKNTRIGIRPNEVVEIAE
jgi:hypothetical protein